MFDLIKKGRLVRSSLLVGGLVSATLMLASCAADKNMVYVQSNNHLEGENAVLSYRQMSDGMLQFAGSYMTGGTGVDNDTNAKLGPNDNDSPVIISDDGRFLFAVNVHSNSIAVFKIDGDGSLEAVDGSPFDSKGVGPVSLTMQGDTLVVANRNEDPNQLDALRGGARANFAAFKVGAGGKLTHINTIDAHGEELPTQVLASRHIENIVFANDFAVDADFDENGLNSRLFALQPLVSGGIETLTLSSDGMILDSRFEVLPETVAPAPEVPSLPLGIWEHPSQKLIYVGLVTRNQLGVYSYDDGGELSFETAVANSGQDICWLRTNEDGTRLYAVNNLPREDENDGAATLTVFDISGNLARQPVEIQRMELPEPGTMFINNRNFMQPGSTAFQLALGPDENFLYVVNQRVDQSGNYPDTAGNFIHVMKVEEDGRLTYVGARDLREDGVPSGSRPMGVAVKAFR